MTTYDMKTISANTAGPASNRSVVFGADNQGAATPVPYDFGALRTAVQGVIYVANRWYLPLGTNDISNGSAPGANVISLAPGFIAQKCTISALGTRLSTLSAAGNFQHAIYANSTAMRPTGTALASTASISTAATGSLNAAVSVQLDMGWYWFATNFDNATAAANTMNSASSNLASVIGSTSQQNELVSSAFTGLTVAQTFNTWPDLTAGSFGDGFTIPIVQFKVGSVP